MLKKFQVTSLLVGMIVSWVYYTGNGSALDGGRVDGREHLPKKSQPWRLHQWAHEQTCAQRCRCTNLFKIDVLYNNGKLTCARSVEYYPDNFAPEAIELEDKMGECRPESGGLICRAWIPQLGPLVLTLPTPAARIHSHWAKAVISCCNALSFVLHPKVANVALIITIWVQLYHWDPTNYWPAVSFGEFLQVDWEHRVGALIIWRYWPD